MITPRLPRLLLLSSHYRTAPASSAAAVVLPLLKATCRLRSYSTNNTTTIDHAAIEKDLMSRGTRITWDVMHPTNSYLLNVALAAVLPEQCFPHHFCLPYDTTTTTTTTAAAAAAAPPPPGHDRAGNPVPRDEISVAQWFRGRAPGAASYRLPPGHHLVYFPLQLPGSSLCGDGADPFPSPGPPWTRRLWAGGSLSHLDEDMLVLGLGRGGGGGMPAVCAERVESVSVRGVPGAEKVFVELLREYYDEDSFVRRLRPAGARNPIVERRTLVFMRPWKPEDQVLEENKAAASYRFAKRRKTPTFAVTITPTQTLLFQYSALSFNAHAIHLDREHARNVEGHRDLLVQGPLSLTIMMAVLGAHRRVSSVTYRHIAPLYVGEPMTVCARRLDDPPEGPRLQPGNPDREKWEVWIENPDGALCVRASAETTRSRNPDAEKKWS
ncbi:hypothetical protein F4809DRAFT_336545 [Biscogniauxia mediterranea]|nr:hypothetical protein F4809DRAFT_336545 [Biscogniauxia mediterranea]